MFAISPTDNSWFEFLKANEYNSYINFWTPTPWNIRKLKQGDRWYFLLKSPIRKIGGFGEFHEYKNLTANNAWQEFGQRNGRSEKDQFVSSIQSYIDKNSKNYGNIPIDINTYEIGCIVLNNCEFWDEEKFQTLEEQELDFSDQIVKYKYFETDTPFTNTNTYDSFTVLNESREEYRRSVNQRKGQGEFKGKILKAYCNACCISGETCPELLEAAHLQSYLSENSNHVQNGILLRVDLHRLFDCGLLYIDEDYIIHISSILTNELYTKFQGHKISLPQNEENHPSLASLKLREANFRK
jgi:putative restriction endonuclease